jgi:rubrerythrin
MIVHGQPAPYTAASWGYPLMSEHKPSYLGTLNAIALGAKRGQKLLTAWRRSTDDAQLAGVLEFLAIREREHAAAFAKRLSELGYSVQKRPSKRFAKHLELARTPGNDVEKFQNILGYCPDGEEPADPLLHIFSDTNIDPTSGALLGRYIAEDRDTARRLHAEFERLAVQPEASDDDPVLRDIATRLDRLTTTLEALKSLRN